MPTARTASLAGECSLRIEPIGAEPGSIASHRDRLASVSKSRFGFGTPFAIYIVAPPRSKASSARLGWRSGDSIEIAASAPTITTPAQAAGQCAGVLGISRLSGKRSLRNQMIRVWTWSRRLRHRCCFAVSTPPESHRPARTQKRARTGDAGRDENRSRSMPDRPRRFWIECDVSPTADQVRLRR